MLLNSELDLTLRPMKYPQFFQLYKDSIKNIWTHRRDRLLGRGNTSTDHFGMLRSVTYCSTEKSISSVLQMFLTESR